MKKDPLDSFRDFIESLGMAAPDIIHGDGKLHRFSPTGKRGDLAGYYVLHLDGIPAGVAGDWRSIGMHRWCDKPDNELTPAEQEAIRARIRAAQRDREIEDTKRKAEAQANAVRMWADAVPAVAHPYLKAEGVQSYGLKISGDDLLVPLRDPDGALWNLQTINPDGVKRFLYGGRVRGLYHAIGRPSKRLMVAEGMATAATLHEASGDAVAVAFNAGNLEPVARALKSKYPDMPMVIAADDDHLTADPRTGELTNPGMHYARIAAAAVGARLAVPDFTGLDRGPRDSDHNDVARLIALKQQKREVSL